MDPDPHLRHLRDELAEFRIAWTGDRAAAARTLAGLVPSIGRT